MPQREQRPYVGLIPTMPVSAAGWRIEPPVSVAVAARQRSAATAADEPPEEPPGTSLSVASPPCLPWRRHGDTTGPKALVSLDEPMANSSQLSLPSITAPAFHRLAPTVDSYVGWKSSRILEQAVVRTPAVQNRSLLPSGHAFERARLARLQALVAVFRLGQRPLRRRQHVSVERGVAGLDRRQKRLRQLGRGEILFAQALARRGDREFV